MHLAIKQTRIGFAHQRTKDLHLQFTSCSYQQNRDHVIQHEQLQTVFTNISKFGAVLVTQTFADKRYATDDLRRKKLDGANISSSKTDDDTEEERL